MENALITGATQGIGRAIAFGFAKQGMNMAICSRNNEDLLALADELKAIAPQIRVFHLATDVSDQAQLLEFARQAQAALGFIKVVVNNAGAFIPSTTLNDANDTYDLLMDTNLRPAYNLYRFFGKSMQEQRSGHIFNICSAAAIHPAANAGTYSVTKAALRSLNTVMKLEMQAYSVKVTAVLPGSTYTESWAGTDIPPDRFVSTTDVANAVLSAYNMSIGANVDEIVIKPVLGQL